MLAAAETHHAGPKNGLGAEGVRRLTGPASRGLPALECSGGSSPAVTAGVAATCGAGPAAAADAGVVSADECRAAAGDRCACR